MKTLDSLLLSDIATRRVLGVTGDCPIAAAARRMGETRVSCLVVMDGAAPCGIITERDLVRLLHHRPAPGALVGDVVRLPVVTAPLHLDFRSAYALLRRHGIRHLVAVGHDGALAGVATATDFRVHLGTDGFREMDELTACLDPVTPTLPPDATLAEALEHMVREPWDYVLVMKDEKPLGILTERDIPLLLAAEVAPEDVQLHEVMSTPVHWVAPESTVREASARMAKLRIRHIAVVGHAQRLIGMLSQDTLMEKIGIAIFDEGMAAEERGSGPNPALHPELDGVMEATAVFAWTYDAVSDRFRCSPNAAALLGHPDKWSPAGFSDWIAMLDPDDRVRLPEHLQTARAAADDRVYETECRLLKPDGTLLPTRIRSRVTRRDHDGRALEVVAVIAAGYI